MIIMTIGFGKSGQRSFCAQSVLSSAEPEIISSKFLCSCRLYLRKKSDFGTKFGYDFDW